MVSTNLLKDGMGAELRLTGMKWIKQAWKIENGSGFQEMWPKRSFWATSHAEILLLSQSCQQLINDCFCVPKQHARVVLEEERILNSGVTGTHTPLHDDRRL